MKREKVLLAPRHKRLLYATTTLLWLTGALWLYLVENDPNRPLWMKLHGAAAMVFLIIFGTLLIQHVPVGWKQNHQRPSGISLLALCGILAATGWGLYYVGGEDIRHWISRVHSILGLALPLIILIHVRMSLRK